jgi:hypothetical protein
MQEALFRMSLKSEPTLTVRDLDQGHVIPEMAPPNWRGIWYPKGFDTDIRDERSSADEYVRVAVPVCKARLGQYRASIGATVTRSFTAPASCRSSVISASAWSWVSATDSASKVSGHPSRTAAFHATF